MACGRGNGTSQHGSDLVLTPATRNPTGLSGADCTAGTSGASRQYRLIDEAHTGVDRFVHRQVQVTGKVERPGPEEAAQTPAIRVAQMSSMGACE